MFKKNVMLTKISLRLDIDLIDRLQVRANHERVPVSYILRHLVLRYLGDLQEIKEPAPLRTGVNPGARGRLWTPPDPDKLLVEFRKECCALFDGFRDQGFDMGEATRRTNFALKAKSHPWATYEVVAKAIRDCGRFRTVRGVKK